VEAHRQMMRITIARAIPVDISRIRFSNANWRSISASLNSYPQCLQTRASDFTVSAHFGQTFLPDRSGGCRLINLSLPIDYFGM
jgi:hypothetical protein